jgi:HAD superfamily hydrolase (TIGR01484 family)
MQLAAFAFDYDGTLAHDGCVAASTVSALRRLRAAGPRLLLVTGRELADLQRTFERYDLFDAIVAENGALLYQPALHEERSLGAAPPEALLRALRYRHVQPLSVGRSIIATCRPHETQLLAAIHECGLEWQIIFNKSAVMCLPPGINKASGLRAALAALGLSPLNVLGVGDAENDHAMLDACGYRVAVANAVETLKDEADIVTGARNGRGVVELIELFLSDPPDAVTAAVRRYDVTLGEDGAGQRVALAPETTALIAGSAGGGKSRLATLLIERIVERGFQLCVVDPEGDYEHLAHLTPLGSRESAPSLDETEKLLRRSDNSVVLNLLGVDLDSRPRYFARLAAMIESLRVDVARPHWLLVDEAHHMIPAAAQAALLAAPRKLPGTIFVTVEPNSVARSLLESVQVAITLGPAALETLEQFCDAVGIEMPPAARPAAKGEALFWDRSSRRQPRVIKLDEPSQAHRRHIRKYAQGDLGRDKSFHFRGPHDALNLRAQNLALFLQLADGVDDDTWLFHLRRSDYSSWFRDAIDDQELAADAERIEQELSEDPQASRRAMRELVNGRYTAPADTSPP